MQNKQNRNKIVNKYIAKTLEEIESRPANTINYKELFKRKLRQLQYDIDNLDLVSK